MNINISTGILIASTGILKYSFPTILLTLFGVLNYLGLKNDEPRDQAAKMQNRKKQ